MPTPEADEGEQRLERWAKWTRGDRVNGYPKMTAFARLVTPTPECVGDMPYDVMETDRAVAHLRHREKSPLWPVIEKRFLRNDSMSVSIKELGMSRAHYYRLLNRAYVKIVHLIRAGALTATGDKK